MPRRPWPNRVSVVPKTWLPRGKSCQRAEKAQRTLAQPSVGCARDFAARRQISKKTAKRPTKPWQNRVSVVPWALLRGATHVKAPEGPEASGTTKGELCQSLCCQEAYHQSRIRRARECWHNRVSVVPETWLAENKSTTMARIAERTLAQASVGCARYYAAREGIIWKGPEGAEVPGTTKGRLCQGLCYQKANHQK